jgi:tetratricopeptide (TPR) repeat protein
LQIYLEALEIDRNISDIHINIANVYYLLDKYDDAINHYIQAIKKNDDKKPDAYYNLGNALCVKKEYKDAIKCFKKVIKYDSSNMEAVFNLGNCLFAIGQFQKAIEKYDVCLKFNPDSKEIKCAMAKSLIELGDKDSLYKSEAIIRALLLYESKDAELLFILALCKEKIGNKVEALEYYKVS